MKVVATWLFVQLIVEADDKEYIKAAPQGSVRRIYGERWIPLRKGKELRKKIPNDIAKVTVTFYKFAWLSKYKYIIQ